jgi:transcriptional regulator with XRE-family HTH domain
MTDMTTVGERVRAKREAAKMSQKELAQAIGVSEYTIIRLEKGRRQAKTGELESIAKVLDVPVSVLMGITPPMYSDVSPVKDHGGTLITVPLLSPEMTVCCGGGIPAYDDLQNPPTAMYRYTIEELGGVFDDMRPPYAVRSEGSCLEKSRIYDGDILIANPAVAPRQGQICIVNWGGALSAKKVVRAADGTIHLYSDVDDFVVSADEASDPEQFAVLGAVVGTRRTIR